MITDSKQYVRKLKLDKEKKALDKKIKTKKEELKKLNSLRDKVVKRKKGLFR